MDILQIGTGMSSISENTATATEAVIFNLSKELSKIANVHLIDFKDKNRKKIPGINYHEIEMPKRWGPEIYTKPGTLNHILRKIFFSIKASLKFISLMNKTDIEIIHCHNQYTGIFISFLNKLFYNKTFIYTVHTPFWTLPKHKLPKYFSIKSIIERICMKNSTMVVAVSNSQKESIEKITNLCPEKITYITNGVDLNKFHQGKTNLRIKLAPNNEKIILCVARISKIKNQMGIIKSIKPIVKKVKSKFIFIGQIDDEYYFQKILDFIRRKKIENYVEFIKSVPNSKIPEYYMAADIFILPSFAEGLPLVLLEAMASGKAIIASNIGPNKEISKSEEIIYFDPNNSEELIKKIIFVLSNPKIIESLGKKARRSAEFFYSWNKIAKQYFSLYESLLN